MGKMNWPGHGIRNATFAWLAAIGLLLALSGQAAAQDDDLDEELEEEDAELDAEAQAETSGEAGASLSASLSGEDGAEADADADAGPLDGFELGARASYGRAFGEHSDGVDIKDAISGQISLQLDLGYRVMPALFVGVYLAGGPALKSGVLKDNCDSDLRFSCQAVQMSAGVQAQYRLRPNTMVDPWVGAGVGIERLVRTRDWDASGSEWTATLAVPQLLLQLGVDFYGDESDAVFGPFLSWSMASYGSESSDCRGSICTAAKQTDDTIDKTAPHYFVNFGLRGTLVL